MIICTNFTKFIYIFKSFFQMSFKKKQETLVQHAPTKTILFALLRMKWPTMRHAVVLMSHVVFCRVVVVPIMIVLII